VGERVADVLARAERTGHDSVVVLDDRGRPQGWPWLRQLRGEAVPAFDHEQLDSLDSRATLNDALDTMLTSGHGAAVVTGDRDQYLGVIGFAAVTEHIRVLQEETAARRTDPIAGPEPTVGPTSRATDAGTGVDGRDG
jgi:osmoprotectant transport system ATP-binding protein